MKLFVSSNPANIKYDALWYYLCLGLALFLLPSLYADFTTTRTLPIWEAILVVFNTYIWYRISAREIQRRWAQGLWAGFCIAALLSALTIVFGVFNHAIYTLNHVMVWIMVVSCWYTQFKLKHPA